MRPLPAAIPPCSPQPSDNSGYVTNTACWTDPLGLRKCPEFPFEGAVTHGPAGPIKMTPYSPKKLGHIGGGCHTPMKAFVQGCENARPLQSYAPAVPLHELQRLNTLSHFRGLGGADIHSEITRAQRRLYGSNASNITVNSWADVYKLEMRAHLEAGVPAEYANVWIKIGIDFYKNNGITSPAHVPWRKP